MGVDGSANSRRAVKTAIDLMDKQRDLIHIVHVPLAMELEPGLGAAVLEELVKRRQESIDQLLNEMRELCSKEGACNVNAFATDTKLGPRAEVVKQAVGLDADFVVLGSRGMSMMQRLVVGSTVDYVLNNLPCTVIVVK